MKEKPMVEARCPRCRDVRKVAMKWDSKNTLWLFCAKCNLARVSVDFEGMAEEIEHRVSFHR